MNVEVFSLWVRKAAKSLEAARSGDLEEEDEGHELMKCHRNLAVKVCSQPVDFVGKGQRHSIPDSTTLHDSLFLGHYDSIVQ